MKMELTIRQKTGALRRDLDLQKAELIILVNEMVNNIEKLNKEIVKHSELESFENKEK